MVETALLATGFTRSTTEEANADIEMDITVSGDTQGTTSEQANTSDNCMQGVPCTHATATESRTFALIKILCLLWGIAMYVIDTVLDGFLLHKLITGRMLIFSFLTFLFSLLPNLVVSFRSARRYSYYKHWGWYRIVSMLFCGLLLDPVIRRLKLIVQGCRPLGWRPNWLVKYSDHDEACVDAQDELLMVFENIPQVILGCFAVNYLPDNDDAWLIKSRIGAGFVSVLVSVLARTAYHYNKKVFIVFIVHYLFWTSLVNAMRFYLWINVFFRGEKYSAVALLISNLFIMSLWKCLYYKYNKRKTVKQLRYMFYYPLIDVFFYYPRHESFNIPRGAIHLLHCVCESLVLKIYLRCSASSCFDVHSLPFINLILFLYNFILTVFYFISLNVLHKFYAATGNPEKAYDLRTVKLMMSNIMQIGRLDGADDCTLRTFWSIPNFENNIAASRSSV